MSGVDRGGGAGDQLRVCVPMCYVLVLTVTRNPIFSIMIQH